MTINKNLYVGTLIMNGLGDRRDVSLKKGVLSWLTANGGRYRHSDGTLVGKSVLRPVLQTSTVYLNLNPDLLYRAITHTARVRAFREKLTFSKPIYLIETKRFFLGEYGEKFSKKTGWAMDNKNQILLETINFFIPEWMAIDDDDDKA
jgi:hypothetical protein